MLRILALGACAFAPGTPRVVDPGPGTTAPPSDAIVLFDGSSAEQWRRADGMADCPWRIEDGAMVVVPGAGSITSRQAFRDIQLHIEFATPAVVVGDGQGRGNSGVYLMGRYEVQILDSFGNETFPKGQCGAIYNTHPPLVNASRPPGEWQTYDIVFRAPRFDDLGNKVGNASITVLHNGVLIHDSAEVPSPTGAAPNRESPGAGPIYLQDHGNPVRFRNIWVRELE